MYEVIGFERKVSHKEGQPDVTYVTIHCRKPMRANQGDGYQVKKFNYKLESVAYEPVLGDLIIPEIEVYGTYPAVVDIVVANDC